VDPGQRLLVQGHAQHVPLPGVECERLLQHLRGAVEVARIGLQLAEVGEGGGEPHVTADLAGDGGAFLQQGPRGVQVAEKMVGDAEAVEFSCLLVPVVQVTPDRQAALEERPRGLRLVRASDTGYAAGRVPCERDPPISDTPAERIKKP
jgi:hypothetical protein